MLFSKTDPRAIAPAAAKPGDAGADLHAIEDTRVPPRGRALIRTGIAVSIPLMHVGRVLSRSGLSLKHGIEAGAGVIDAGYRGEIGVVLHNHTDEAFHVAAGDRIAQLVVTPIMSPGWYEVDELDPLLGTDGTHRGESGFGSTGVSASAVRRAVTDPTLSHDERTRALADAFMPSDPRRLAVRQIDRIEGIKRFVEHVIAMGADCDGIAGYHRNDELLPWDELIASATEHAGLMDIEATLAGAIEEERRLVAEREVVVERVRLMLEAIDGLRRRGDAHVHASGCEYWAFGGKPCDCWVDPLAALEAHEKEHGR